MRRRAARVAEKKAKADAAAQKKRMPDDGLRSMRQGYEDTTGTAFSRDVTRVIADAESETGDSEGANLTRSASARAVELMRALHRRATAKGARRQEANGCNEALLRLYSNSNVRTALQEAAVNDSELALINGRANIMAREGATRTGLGVENFLARNARPTDNDITIMTDTLERQTATAANQARAAKSRIEGVELPRLEVARARAYREYQKAKGTKKETAAEADYQKADRAVQVAEDRLARANEAIMRPENQPLARTESILGIRFTAEERGSMVARLKDTGIITGDAIVTEVRMAEARAGSTLGRFQLNGDPVMESMRNAVGDSIGRGESVDDALLSALRSNDVARQIGQRHGAPAEAAFRKAVEGASSVDGAIEAMRSGVEIEGGSPTPFESTQHSTGIQVTTGATVRVPEAVVSNIEAFTRLSREHLADDFFLIQHLMPKADEAVTAARIHGGAFGHELTGFWQYMGDTWPATLAKKVGVGVGKGIKFFEYDIGADGYRVVRDAPAGAIGRKVSGIGSMSIQGIIYASEIGLGMYMWQRYKSPGTLEDNIAFVKKNFGRDVVVSDDNARWTGTAIGREFLAAIPNNFPPRDKRDAGTPDELLRMLGRKHILVDPSRLDTVLTDGRQMAGSLGSLNDSLKERKENPGKAEGEISQILRPWGITLADVDQLLARKNKTELDIRDLTELRVNDWIGRGIAVRFNDVVAETFLAGTGVAYKRGDENTTLLVSNPEAFVALWSLFQRGYLPAAYVDDALKLLGAKGVMEDLRTRMAGGASMDDLVRGRLTSAGFILGQAMDQNSFLGRMERKMVEEDAKLRPVVERILGTAKSDSATISAFNGFLPPEITIDSRGRVSGGEDVFGDPEKLAGLIADNKADPAKALSEARRQGFVGPAILGDIDPSMKAGTDANQSLVRFVAERTDANEEGVLKWVKKHAENLRGSGHLSAVLSDLREACDPKRNPLAPSTPAEIEAYAERQIGNEKVGYKARGWWRGSTPDEAAQKAIEKERTKRKSKGAGAAAESAANLAVPRKVPTDTYFARRAMAGQETLPGEAGATAEAKLVFDDNARSFFQKNKNIDTMVESIVAGMYDDARDGQIMRNGLGSAAKSDTNPHGIPTEAMEQAKAEIYRLIKSDAEADWRSANGITVSQNGDVTVSVRAANGLRMKIFDLAKKGAK